MTVAPASVPAMPDFAGRDACATPDGAARHPNIADQTGLERIRPQTQGTRTNVVRLRAGSCIRPSASLAAVASS